MGPAFRFGSAWWVAALFCGVGGGQNAPAISYIYTQAARYEADAGLQGGERFPAGAAAQLVSGAVRRELAPGFAASADAVVSFDGLRALFAGKQRASDPWEIWEIGIEGGKPRKVSSDPDDCIAPFYLPDGIVYACRTSAGFQLFRVARAGGDTVQLTYGPGHHIPSDVLRDGRILFDGPHQAGRDIYTIYPDGTGVETYRCDHGRDRHAAREVSSGDIVFETGGRLARFTSARAAQMDVTQPAGEVAGPVAEIAPGEWLVSYRPSPGAPYRLYRMRGGQALPEKAADASGANALQPVLVRPHPAPKRFPSAIRERAGANLLCLNAYVSKLKIAAGSVHTARVWELDDQGTPVVLGQAPVESDGSFFIMAPGERAIRFELLDRAGKTVAAEKGWFWARRGEQRVCVGCHAGPEHSPENAQPLTLLRSTDPVELLKPAGGSQ
ncbi:MAG: hypothetical protein LAQ30_02680 [Acidobacteriia bacterium]|nr:hypothetical protein [Terriglobia bacterium]